MADEALQVTLSANDEGLASELSSMEDRLVKLETAYKAGDVAALGFSASATKSGESAAAAGGEVQELGLDLEQMAGHAGTAARGLGAMGFEAEAAAARVEGLLGVIGELKGAVPELLAIGAAFVAITASISFFKDGMTAATDMQAQLETMRAAVEAQNGAWDSASKAIADFVTQESIASGFTQNELVGSLNMLVAAGADVHDSMMMVGVAEEVAIGQHKSLRDITQALVEAESGRGQTLAILDPKIRAIIKSHGDLGDVLDELHQKYGKQIDDDTSLERAEARKKAALEASAQQIGTDMIPILTYLDQAFIGAITVSGDFANAIGTGVRGAAMMFVDSAMAIVHGAEAAGDALKGNFSGAKDQIGAAAASLKSFGSDMRDASIGWLPGTIKGAGDLFHMHAMGHDQVNQANYRHDERLRSIHLDDNPSMTQAKGHHAAGHHAGHHVAGHHAGAHGSLPFDFQEIPDAAKQSTAAITIFENTIKDLPKTVDGYQQAVLMLSTQLTKEKDDQLAQTSEVSKAFSAYESARAAANAYGETLKGHTGVTAAEKQHLTELKQAVSETQKSYDGFEKSLKATDHELAVHGQMLKAAQDSLSKLTSGFDDYVKTSTAKMQDDLRVFQMTNAQKVSYYAQMVASIQVIDDASLKQKEAYYQKELDAYKTMTDDEVKAQQKFYADAEKHIGTFLNDVLVQHKSLSDGLKSIYDDMLKNFIAMVEKMIVESKLFKELFGNLAPSMSGSPAAAGPGGAPNILTSVLGLFSSGGGSTAPSATQVEAAGNAQGQYGGFLSDLTTNLTGSPSGVTPGSTTASANTMTPQEFQKSAAGVAGGALMGYEVGASEYPGKPWSKGLGSAGGAVGEYFGGPLGAMLGSQVGAFLGSLLGPHWGPATNYPDRSDTQHYGQFVTDINGATGSFNGSTINPEAAFDPNQGGTNMAQDIENWVKSQKGTTSSMTPAELASYNQLTALIGGSVDPTALKIASEKNGMFTLEDGQQISVQDYEKLVSQWQTSTGGAAAASPVFSITRTYPDYNIANPVSGQPTAPRTAPGTPGPNNPQDGNGPGSHGLPGQRNVMITVNGSLIGGSPEDIALKLSQLIRQTDNGSSFNGGAINRRTYGDFRNN